MIMALQMMNATLFFKAKSPLKILRIAQSLCHVSGWSNLLNGLLRSDRQSFHEPAKLLTGDCLHLRFIPWPYELTLFQTFV